MRLTREGPCIACAQAFKDTYARNGNVERLLISTRELLSFLYCIKKSTQRGIGNMKQAEVIWRGKYVAR